MYKDELGRYKSDDGGFVYCDGVTVENVYWIEVDYCDDEIVLRNNRYDEVGMIMGLSNKELCIFSEDDVTYRKVIVDGVVQLD